ncbi:hypothetical protein SK128_013144 [Halocaridina rubra]|uniref:Uncharacterized protein n=1 Tax=Halocaridina rubra TaxID=373956 RepID=A0AAN8WU74_HALRR
MTNTPNRNHQKVKANPQGDDTSDSEGVKVNKDNLEEVREYSLALYRHLQEQLRSRQLDIPRPRNKNKRRRVTRQTVLPTEENVTEGRIGELDIENMLMQGMNFIPPVDPKQLRSALHKLLELVNTQKKKGNSYPKRSGYTYLPPDKGETDLNDEDLSRELVTPSSQKQRLLQNGNANIDASISFDNQQNGGGDVELFIDIVPSSTPATSAKHIAQEIHTAIDVRDYYIPPKGIISTLGRGSKEFRPSGRRRPYWARRRRYKGYRHNCPDDDTTTPLNMQTPLIPTASSVLPTLPSRPTIPEIDFTLGVSTTPSTVPGNFSPLPTPQIPGAIPTPNTTPNVLDSVPTITASDPLTLLPDGTNDYDDYSDGDSASDNDVYDYFDIGVDPGLTNGRTQLINATIILDSSNVNNSDESTLLGLTKGTENQGQVILLIDPKNESNENQRASIRNLPLGKERGVSGSTVILVDSNDDGRNLLFRIKLCQQEKEWLKAQQ